MNEILTMNRDEMLAKMAEIKDSVGEKVKKYNSLLLEENLVEAAKLDTEIGVDVSTYAALAKAVCFEDLRKTDDPMMSAVIQLTFTVIAVKDVKVEGSTIPVRELQEKEKPIDLKELHKFCGGIGKNENWLYMAEKFNYLLTAKAAEDLGIAPEKLKELNDSYAMAKIAQDIDLGKNPTSKTQLLKTLRTIIAAMVGEEYTPKVISKDVKFLLLCYGKKSNKKALTVQMATHKTMRNLLAEICHRVVLDLLYEVEYKKMKV